MKTTMRFLRPLAAFALLAVAGASQAALTVYTTEAAYLAAIANPGTDTFDDLPLGGTIDGPLNRTAGVHTYATSSSAENGFPDSFFPAGSPGDVWLSTNSALSTIAFYGFSPGVVGIGGFFFGSDIAGDFLAGQTLSLLATDGGGSVSETIFNATTRSFLGFVSDGALASLTVSVIQPEDAFAWPTVNNVTLGSVVPEPETYALMIGGLGLLGFMARRRR